MKSRELAYRIVEEVEVHGAYLNLILPRFLNGVSEQDARFVTQLVSGMYRNRSFLDFVISTEAKRDLTKIDAPLRDILRIGTYQILFMRTENYAAVAETVDLVSLTKLASARGFVNATLRSVSQRDVSVYRDAIIASTDNSWERLALLYSHPLWIVKAAAEALHADVAEVEALLQRNNEVPPVTLVSRAGEFANNDSALYSPYALQIDGNPYRHPLVLDGKAQVQDEASQLVAQVIANFPINGRDVSWLDLCSGPGGKAMLLKQCANSRGAELTAVELHPHRAQLVKDALEGIPGNSRVEIADGRDKRFATGEYDRVLVDAPCLGLGALRRRAESRWRKQAADLTDLVPLQKALLINALDAIRPGGVVGYATCSWHLSETEYVIEDILKRRSDAKLLDIQPGLDGIAHLKDREKLLSKDPYLHLWPHIHDTDGMFMALLTRE